MHAGMHLCTYVHLSVCLSVCMQDYVYRQVRMCQPLCCKSPISTGSHPHFVWQNPRLGWFNTILICSNPRFWLGKSPMLLLKSDFCWFNLNFPEGLLLGWKLKSQNKRGLAATPINFAGSRSQDQPTSRLPTRAFSSRILFSAWCGRLRWEWRKTLHSNDLVMLGIWNLLGMYWEIQGCYDAMDFLECNLDHLDIFGNCWENIVDIMRIYRRCN